MIILRHRTDLASSPYEVFCPKCMTYHLVDTIEQMEEWFCCKSRKKKWETERWHG